MKNTDILVMALFIIAVIFATLLAIIMEEASTKTVQIIETGEKTQIKELNSYSVGDTVVVVYRSNAMEIGNWIKNG